jgi:hypothetical protein
MPVRVFNMVSPGIMGKIMMSSDDGTTILCGENKND